MLHFEHDESFKIGEELYARVIGRMVLQHLKEENLLDTVSQNAQNDAYRILAEIRHILDDDSYDDPECFKRIEQIVELFHSNNIGTTRHE